MTLVAGGVSPAAGVAGVHGFLTLERRHPTSPVAGVTLP